MHLNADPELLHETYRSASPFPHIVVDGLFDETELGVVLEQFPAPGMMRWQSFENPAEKKLGFHYEMSALPAVIETFLHRMNSPPLLRFLEGLTGIEGLIPDPYFGGGGLHQIVRGGFLKVHADFNWHPKLRLDRRLNMLVYLNRDWREQWGGALELWSRDGSRPEVSILPLFNRTVIFSTTDTSFHGHPAPLACPEGVTRKSVSLYYYTNGRPEAERSAPHDTIFLEV